MKNFALAAVLVAFLGFGLTGCNTTPQTEEKRDALHDDARAALSAMKADSPDFAAFVDKSYAYAVFPSVGEGALIVGAGGGRGEVYQEGKMIGYSTVKKATIGAQIGGQAYSQVIVFENEAALKKFISSEYQFAANANAVALKSGIATNARFQDGIAVFQHTKGGLMAAAAIGGQTFHFNPL